LRPSGAAVAGKVDAAGLTRRPLRWRKQIGLACLQNGLISEVSRRCDCPGKTPAKARRCLGFPFVSDKSTAAGQLPAPGGIAAWRLKSGGAIAEYSS
jgi:hypothetical protein